MTGLKKKFPIQIFSRVKFLRVQIFWVKSFFLLVKSCQMISKTAELWSLFSKTRFALNLSFLTISLFCWIKNSKYSYYIVLENIIIIIIRKIFNCICWKICKRSLWSVNIYLFDFNLKILLWKIKPGHSGEKLVFSRQRILNLFNEKCV